MYAFLSLVVYPLAAGLGGWWCNNYLSVPASGINLGWKELGVLYGLGRGLDCLSGA